MTTSDMGRVLDAGATAGAVISADRFGGLAGGERTARHPKRRQADTVRRLNLRGGRPAQGGNMRWLVSMLGLALLAVPLLAHAQTDAVYALGRFSFENGGEIADMKVGYVTWGKLNDAKDNAILLLPGTSAGRHFAAAHIGPGKTYDTDKYFVIGVDPIGGGNSSSPKDGLGTAFPKYTIRDMVRAQHVMVTKGLGLTHLLAVGGSSMGSFQSVEWGINYPDFMTGLILIVPAARSDQQFPEESKPQYSSRYPVWRFVNSHAIMRPSSELCRSWYVGGCDGQTPQ